jgi:hypothetical protein
MRIAISLPDQPRKHEKAIERACRAANDDAALTAEVAEWQAFDDPLPQVADR